MIKHMNDLKLIQSRGEIYRIRLWEDSSLIKIWNSDFWNDSLKKN